MSDPVTQDEIRMVDWHVVTKCVVDRIENGTDEPDAMYLDYLYGVMEFVDPKRLEAYPETVERLKRIYATKRFEKWWDDTAARNKIAERRATICASRSYLNDLKHRALYVKGFGSPWPNVGCD